jgi:DNA-binding transcriptional MerR regulator
MYKISDFSKITRLTVKALRYYDEENLLTPSFRDEENGYRYYSDADFQKAQLISLLRSLDFTISEVKDVLSGCEDPSDLSFYLEEKKSRILQNIEREKELMDHIDLYIKPRNREDNSMDYKIEIKTIPPVIVASIRYKGKYGDTGKYIGKIYKAVKNHAAGAPFQCYYDAEYKEEADIELCVPTSKPVEQPGINSRKLPEIKGITTFHKGSYGKINLAYKALLDYAAKSNLRCTTPFREIYHKRPGMIFKGNENNYLTEIILPIEEV